MSTLLSKISISNGNVRKFYIYQFFYSLDFLLPVVVLFLASKGLSMSEIMLLQSIYAVGVVLLEVPTGAFADYVGKRASLIGGAFFFGLGYLSFVLADNFWQLIISELIVALGITCVSGADSAFLHESLISAGKEKEYKAVAGRGKFFMQVSKAVSGFLGGYLASIALPLAALVTAIANFIASAVAVTFKKPNTVVPREEKTNYLTVISESIAHIRKSPSILWLVVYGVFFINIFSWTNIWFSQPYFSGLGLAEKEIGVIFGISMGFAAVVANFADKLARYFRQYFLHAIALAAFIAVFIIGFISSPLVVPLWAVLFSLYILMEIIIPHEILKLVPQNRAATILSFKSLARYLLGAVMAPFLGLLSDAHGAIFVFQLLSGFVFIAIIILFFIWKKHPWSLAGWKSRTGKTVRI